MDFYYKFLNNIFMIALIIIILYCCYVTLTLDDIWKIIAEQKELIKIQEKKILQLQILILKDIGVIS